MIHVLTVIIEASAAFLLDKSKYTAVKNTYSCMFKPNIDGFLAFQSLSIDWKHLEIGEIKKKQTSLYIFFYCLFNLKVINDG
mgnify:CR=1 FL=1